MKYIIALTLILTAATASAQLPVTDWLAAARLAQQVILAKQQLLRQETQLQRWGDPAAVVTTMAPALMQSLDRVGVGQTGFELRTSATGTAGVQYDGDGLYLPPGETILTSDGQEFQRRIESYKKFDAVTRGRAALEQVMEDTTERLQQLRGQMKASVAQTESSTTMAEVQKLQCVITAQSADLASIDRERDAALGAIIVAGIENQADAARQEESRLEERIVDFRTSSDKFARLMTPDTRPIVIPDPRKRLQ